MSRSDEIDQLAAALCAAQADFTAIPKGTDNPFFKAKYAALPDVVKTASPVLSKHGLAVSQFPATDESGDLLTTWLLHKSGQFIVDSMRLHTVPLPKRSAVDAQAQGSALTYARRYAYMAALGLVAEDDDGNAAARPASQVAEEPLATADDVAELKVAAQGLKVAQIRMGFAACGLASGGELDFGLVPQAKAAGLAAVLAATKRES